MPFFEPEELKVFETLPADQKNTKIQEEFVALAGRAKLPQNVRDWERLRTGALALLREKSFRAWPQEPGDALPVELAAVSADGVRLTVYDLETQPSVHVRLMALTGDETKLPTAGTLQVADEAQWRQLVAGLRVHFRESLPGEAEAAADEGEWNRLKGQLSDGRALLFLAPRGIGPSAWSGDERKQTQIQRRFYLLGQSVDGMRVFDICQAVRSLQNIEPLQNAQLTLAGRGPMAGNVLYAALFAHGIERLQLTDLPSTHRNGPYLLNVSQIWELPQAVAAAVERLPVELMGGEAAAWTYPAEVAELLGQGDRLKIVTAAPTTMP